MHFSHQDWTLPLENVVFLECRKGHFEGRQGQMVTLACFQNPKTDEVSLKIGKSKKSNNITLRLVTGSGFKSAKQDYNIFLETFQPFWGFGNKPKSPFVLVDPQNDPFYTPKNTTFARGNVQFRCEKMHFSHQDWTLPLQNVVFLECRKGHFEGRQGQMVTLACFQNPKTDEVSLKIGNSKKSNNITLRLVTGSGFKLAKQDYNIFLETFQPFWGFGNKPKSPFVLVDPQNDPFYTPRTPRFQGEVFNLDAKCPIFRTKIATFPLEIRGVFGVCRGSFRGQTMPFNGDFGLFPKPQNG